MRLPWADNQISNDESLAGFNMPYSTASTWNQGIDTLILTINPKAQKNGAKKASKSAQDDEHVPDAPWSAENEFFEGDFPRRILFQRAVEQIAKALGDTPDRARNSYAIWSVVPFRTKSEAAVSEKLWDDALYKVWGPIFDLWLPANIFVLGKDAYEVIKDAVSMHAFFAHEKKAQANDYSRNSNRSHRLKCARFRTPGGKEISVFRLPHPTQFCWFYTGDHSIAYRFVAQMREWNNE